MGMVVAERRSHGRIAIISIDGHVKASRCAYRDYIEKKYLEVYDEQVKAAEEAGPPRRRQPAHGFRSGSPVGLGSADEEPREQGRGGRGAVPNGRPFQVNRLDDFASSQNVEQAEEGRRAYNRWLVDFCSLAPSGAGVRCRSPSKTSTGLSRMSTGRRSMGWVYRAASPTGGTFFFDPRFDPVWAAAQEVGLVISSMAGPGCPVTALRVRGDSSRSSTENAFFLISVALAAHRQVDVFERFPEPADGPTSRLS